MPEGATPEGPVPEDAAWTTVVVPDDLRDLQADIDAYHRELRLARRRRRRERLLASAAWQRWSFPVGVLTGALVLAALAFVVIAVDGGVGRRHAPRPVPLAAPRVATGATGGLLPDVPVTLTGGARQSMLTLRPALVALLPVHCDCVPLLEHLAAEANEVQLQLVVVAPTTPDAEVAALPGQIHRGRVMPVYDAAGAVARTYDATGVTALVVGRDGVVTYVKRSVTAATSLELPLQSALLVDPASSAS